MKFKTFKCPECGAAAIGTVDTVPATALFTEPTVTDEVDYCGESKMHWDGQTTVTDEDGFVCLTCGSHEWYTEVEDGQ